MNEARKMWQYAKTKEGGIASVLGLLLGRDVAMGDWGWAAFTISMAILAGAMIKKKRKSGEGEE